MNAIGQTDDTWVALKMFFFLCLRHERKEQVHGKKTYVRLWVHEAFRVFYDRLVDDADRKWFFEETRTVVNTHFKVGFKSGRMRKFSFL